MKGKHPLIFVQWPRIEYCLSGYWTWISSHILDLWNYRCSIPWSMCVAVLYFLLLYGKRNPCALIGSFSVRILQYGPFPWKRSNPCVFVLEQSRQIQHWIQHSTFNCENCHSSHWNYQQKLRRLNFFRNFKDGWRRRTFFKCKPPEVHFAIRNRVPYNKLLTNRACSGRTGEYWPSVVFVRTSLRSVRTVTTSGKYPPVRPSRLVSKRLVIF